MHLFIGERIATSPLGMETGYIIGNGSEGIIDLVVDSGLFSPYIFQCQSGALMKGHFPVGVHSSGRIDRDRERGNIAALTPAVGEEVSYGALDGGIFFAVPVGTQDEPSPVSWKGGQP